MKKRIIVAVLFLVTTVMSSSIFAQKVYSCQYKSDARDNSGIWYFCEYKSDADIKIYFCEYKSDADIVIFFSKYKSDARWQKNEKKHLMYKKN